MTYILTSAVAFLAGLWTATVVGREVVRELDDRHIAYTRTLREQHARELADIRAAGL